jgi:hypothetical protein
MRAGRDSCPRIYKCQIPRAVNGPPFGQDLTYNLQIVDLPIKKGRSGERPLVNLATKLSHQVI